MFYLSEVLVSFYEQGDISGLFTLKMKKEGGEER